MHARACAWGRARVRARAASRLTDLRIELRAGRRLRRHGTRDVRLEGRLDRLGRQGVVFVQVVQREEVVDCVHREERGPGTGVGDAPYASGMPWNGCAACG
jgi:hypothetical protein